MVRRGHRLGPGRSTRACLGFLTVLAMTSGCTAEATNPVVDTSYEVPAKLHEVTVQRFEYPTHDTCDPEQNWADLYLPPGEQRIDSIPLVTLIHGNARHGEQGAEAFDPLARELANRGMAAYNIGYRKVGSGGGWPTTYSDITAALDNVVEVDKHFPQLTTDDELVVGHGTGAQLAVWGATRHKLGPHELGANPAFRPTRVVSLAGPLDMVHAAENGDSRIPDSLGGTPSELPDRYAEVDPIQNIDPSTPVVALHGAQDVTVTPESSQRYVDEVIRQGGHAKMVLLAEANHVSIVSEESTAHPRVLEIIRHASAAHLNESTG